MKHFPQYVNISEYLEYEKRLLDPSSFTQSFDLSFIKRDKIREMYKLINAIRIDSLKYTLDHTSQIEYFISLFIIFYRQLQYWDLNQLLRLKICELLPKELEKKLYDHG